MASFFILTTILFVQNETPIITTFVLENETQCINAQNAVFDEFPANQLIAECTPAIFPQEKTG